MQSRCNQRFFVGIYDKRWIFRQFLELVPALFPTPILLKWALGRMRYNIFLIPQLL